MDSLKEQEELKKEQELFAFALKFVYLKECMEKYSITPQQIAEGTVKRYFGFK